jgi:hypothetical protein
MRVLFATLALLLTANGYGAANDAFDTQAIAQRAAQTVADKEAASMKLEAEARDCKTALDKAWDKFRAAQKGPTRTDEERAKTHQNVADAEAEIEKAAQAESKAYIAAKSAREAVRRAREDAEIAAREENAAREAAAKAVATPPGQPRTPATVPIAQPPADQQLAGPPAQQKDPSTSRGPEIVGAILAIGLIALLILWILWKFACLIVLILAAFCNAFGIKRWPGLFDLADQINAERQRARETRANTSPGFSKTSIYAMGGLGWYELRKQREAMENQAEELRKQTRLMEDRNQELRRKH